ncbi:MAG: histidinol-phosphate transaminase, partial [Candidatus Fonsibacter sp.]
MTLKFKKFFNIKYLGGLSKIKNIKNPIKLSANESALGPSLKAINAYNQTRKKLFRYPDGDSNNLISVISKVFNLNSKKVIIG